MSRFKKIQKIPIAVIWCIISIIMVTFIDYAWILSAGGRFLFVVFCLIGSLLITAMNADLEFWGYDK